MKQTVSFCDFERAFADYNRLDNFSYVGRRALFDYLEELEEDTGEEIELDIIALCCDFSEYSSALEAAKEYSFAADDDDDEEEQEEAAFEWLQDQTIVIPTDDGGVIIQGF